METKEMLKCVGEIMSSFNFVKAREVMNALNIRIGDNAYPPSVEDIKDLVLNIVTATLMLKRPFSAGGFYCEYAETPNSCKVRVYYAICETTTESKPCIDSEDGQGL